MKKKAKREKYFTELFLKERVAIVVVFVFIFLRTPEKITERDAKRAIRDGRRIFLREVTTGWPGGKHYIFSEKVRRIPVVQFAACN